MDTLIANAVGIALYPIVWAQFGLARSKQQFLTMNLASCAVFALSFYLVGQTTAAAVSLAAGAASLGQVIFCGRSIFIRVSITVAAITVALLLAQPETLFDWLAAMMYGWVRLAESLRENIMRTMYVVSPAVWIVLIAHAGNYALIPVDLVALFFAIRWIVLKLDGSSKHAAETQKTLSAAR